jgi:hypothetical protein
MSWRVAEQIADILDNGESGIPKERLAEYRRMGKKIMELLSDFNR